MRFSVTRTTARAGAPEPPCTDDRLTRASVAGTLKWVLELATLEELVEFAATYGHEDFRRVIRLKPGRGDKLPNLEIQDDYH